MSRCDLIDLGTIYKAQDIGFLICVNLKTDSMRMNIGAVSSNIHRASFASDAVSHDPLSCVGKSVLECFSDRAAKKMSQLLEQHLCKRTAKCSFVCEASDQEYFLTLVPTRHGCVFEFIPGFSIGNTVDIDHLFSIKTCNLLFDTACSTVMRSLKYERGFVYQFQQDLSGKVVYEKMRPGREETMESWMDMYFPQSDIPLPARQMFLINQIRVVFDTERPPIDIIGPQGSVEISKCTLRAIHPVHLSYMKNMGIRSSLSIAIVVENDLWGLMCFHSYREAIYPSGYEIALSGMMSSHVSRSIFNIQQTEYHEQMKSLSSIVDESFSSNSILDFFAKNARPLQTVLGVDCICVCINSRIQSWGEADLALDEHEVETVSSANNEGNFSMTELSYPSRGVITIRHGDITLVLVRKSMKFDKAWAGDPNYIKLLRPDGVPGPRGSFERYIESGADSLNKWDTRDKGIASYLSSRIKMMSDAVKQQGPLLLPQSGDVSYNTIPTQPVFDPILISHFSHEMNTPLHQLSSIIQLLLEDSHFSFEDTHEHLEQCLRCIGTASSVVKSVLSVAGGEQLTCIGGHQHVETISLEDLTGALLNKYKKETKITATCFVDKQHSRILVDTLTLRETLDFIMENSIRSGASDVYLSISCTPTHRESVLAWKNETVAYSHRNIRNSEKTSRIELFSMWYTFSVRDSGCGIHRDMLDNVLAFKDNSRTLTAITKSHQGVGIDIYRCIRNIFGMNGSIAIASTVSQGSIVSIMVPAQVDDAPDADASSISSINTEDLGTFMVVDDNTVSQKLAARLVQVACQKKFGVSPVIKTFSDGKHCVEEMKLMNQSDEKIMGILMDYHMPVMSGKEATACIRESETRDGHSKIPIIGFTADSTDATKKRTFKLRDGRCAFKASVGRCTRARVR